jgi:hypothetical protein
VGRERDDPRSPRDLATGLGRERTEQRREGEATRDVILGCTCHSRATSREQRARCIELRESEYRTPLRGTDHLERQQPARSPFVCLSRSTDGERNRSGRPAQSEAHVPRGAKDLVSRVPDAVREVGDAGRRAFTDAVSG